MGLCGFVLVQNGLMWQNGFVWLAIKGHFSDSTGGIREGEREGVG